MTTNADIYDIKAQVARILGFPVPEWLPEEVLVQSRKSPAEIAEEIQEICALFEGPSCSPELLSAGSVQGQVAACLGVAPDDLDPAWEIERACREGLSIKQIGEKILSTALALEDLEEGRTRGGE